MGSSVAWTCGVRCEEREGRHQQRAGQPIQQDTATNRIMYVPENKRAVSLRPNYSGHTSQLTHAYIHTHLSPWMKYKSVRERETRERETFVE